jgi:hypothetical protein
LIFTLVAGARGAETPVTPNASPEVCSLLAYFSAIYHQHILSGQQTGVFGTNGMAFEANYITNTTGKLPAVLGFDFTACTVRASAQDTRHLTTQRAIDWANQRHGIVSFCWHWIAPTNERAFYAKDTTFNLTRGVTEGTPEYQALLRDIDTIAGELKLLQAAHVPVLWRPMHEVNGRWFWWGAFGPESYKKLWRLMFDRLTTYHKINNLIWVFSPGASTDLADWYPGDEYVDMIGQDHYPMNGDNGPARDVFDELSMLGRGTKLLALSENGPIPDPDRLVSEKAGWLFFTTWSGNVLMKSNSKEQLTRAYHNPYVLNLDDLPDVKRFPFKAAGKAVKLGFPASPGDVACGGTRRLPVTVAVEDAEGRIVRNETVAVTLSLGDGGDRAKLQGTLTVKTINGVAVFRDLKMDNAGAYTLKASANSLRDATSDRFQVGPGDGIQREWWTAIRNTSFSDASDFDRQPAGREVLSRGFEAPVLLSTNFAARFRGYLLPPATGQYVFWIANEAVSELWLSTDDAPDNKVKIAEVTGKSPYTKWPHSHEVESVPVTLEAGKRYYLEVRQKQGAGSTQMSVRWRLPDGVEERPIPACRIASLREDQPRAKLTQN